MKNYTNPDYKITEIDIKLKIDSLTDTQQSALSYYKTYLNINLEEWNVVLTALKENLDISIFFKSKLSLEQYYSVLNILREGLYTINLCNLLTYNTDVIDLVLGNLNNGLNLLPFINSESDNSDSYIFDYIEVVTYCLEHNIDLSLIIDNFSTLSMTNILDLCKCLILGYDITTLVSMDDLTEKIIEVELVSVDNVKLFIVYREDDVDYDEDNSYAILASNLVEAKLYACLGNPVFKPYNLEVKLCELSTTRGIIHTSNRGA